MKILARDALPPTGLRAQFPGKRGDTCRACSYTSCIGPQMEHARCRTRCEATGLKGGAKRGVGEYSTRTHLSNTRRGAGVCGRAVVHVRQGGPAGRVVLLRLVQPHHPRQPQGKTGPTRLATSCTRRSGRRVAWDDLGRTRTYGEDVPRMRRQQRERVHAPPHPPSRHPLP